MLNHFLDDAPVSERCPRISGGPGLGCMFAAEVILTRLERFQCHCAVAVVVILALIEVVAAPVYRQLATPIVGIAPIDYGSAGVDALDQIGAGAQRMFQCGCLEVAFGPEVPG